MKIGSQEHRDLFCETFVRAHRRYQAETLPWPELEERHVRLLQCLVPIWSCVLRDEYGNGAFLERFAREVSDPVVREAVEVQATEEHRHGRILSVMLERYGIEVPPFEPREVPPDLERAFVRFGFSECADAFLGFGFYEVIRRTGFFPSDFVDIFETFLDEEAQHIAFFVNWLGHRHADSWMPSRPLAAVWGYGHAFGRLAGLAGGGVAVPEGDASEGLDELAVSVTPSSFVAACVSEYDRRMAAIPEPLLRPRLLPAAARRILPALEWRWPERDAGGFGEPRATP